MKASGRLLVITAALGVAGIDLISGLLAGYDWGTAWAKELSKQEEQEEIVFPPPPDKPRIKYLYEVARPRDLELPGSRPWYKEVLNYLLGKKEYNLKVLTRPYGVCYHAERIYAVDSEAGAVMVFDKLTRKVYPLGGDIHSKLICPIGVAADGSGTVYVTDAEQKAVKVFGVNGKFIYQLGARDELGRPTGIAYDSVNRRILVVDTPKGRILAYNLQGKLVSILGKRGVAKDELSMPVDITVDQQGCIYIVSPIRDKNIVQKFSSDGKLLFAFGEQGDAVGYIMRPKGIAVDSKGHIYVADAMFSVIQIFNQKGQIMLFFGGHGSLPGQFGMPVGLAMDEQDRIYAVDSLNRRVQVFQYIHYDEEEKPN